MGGPGPAPGEPVIEPTPAGSPEAAELAGPLVAFLRRVPFTAWVTGLLVAGSVLFVLWVVNPDGVLFTDTTPTGGDLGAHVWGCLLYTSPSPRDLSTSRMPSSA